MNKLYTTQTIVIIACLSGCSNIIQDNNKPATPSTINALWNDSGKNGDIGFWLYEENGTCPSIRKNPPIAFSPAKSMPSESAENVSVKDLEHCFEVLPKIPVKYGNNCESGEVSYKYQANENRYYGTYKMHFTNGKFIEGDFIAEYCPPSK